MKKEIKIVNSDYFDLDNVSKVIDYKELQRYAKPIKDLPNNSNYNMHQANKQVLTASLNESNSPLHLTNAEEDLKHKYFLRLRTARRTGNAISIFRFIVTDKYDYMQKDLLVINAPGEIPGALVPSGLDEEDDRTPGTYLVQEYEAGPLYQIENIEELDKWLNDILPKKN